MRVASRVLLSVGTIAAHILVSYRLASGPSPRPRTATVPIVIAQRDLAAGDRIGSMDVVVAKWPVGTVPTGAYSSVEQVVALRTSAAVFKGEAIIPRRLIRVDARGARMVQITPGMRAMSFRVNDITGAPGIVRPNTRVDILVVKNADGKRPVAKLFIRNQRLLAIGVAAPGYGSQSVGSAAVATVEVTPEQAERLAIAMTQGELRLVLSPTNSFDPPSDVDQGIVTPRSTDLAPEQPNTGLPPRRLLRPDTMTALPNKPVVSHAVILRY